MALEEDFARNIGSEVQPSSPVGASVHQLADRLDGEGVTFSVDLLRAAGGQVQMSSPLGQFLQRFAKVADDLDDPKLPEIRARLGLLGSQLGEGPLKACLRKFAYTGGF